MLEAEVGYARLLTSTASETLLVNPGEGPADYDIEAARPAAGLDGGSWGQLFVMLALAAVFVGGAVYAWTANVRTSEVLAGVLAEIAREHDR